MALFLISFLSYIIGSIPFSYIIASFYKKNLFEIGSNNIGTANVWRATGKIFPTFLALLGDVSKGAFSIFLANKLLFLGYDLTKAQFLAAVFVIVGHNWPVFLKFRGGRGLASLAGVILALNWQAIALALITIIVCIMITELITAKGLDLSGSFKEKFKKFVFSLTSQITGRMIGILASVALIYFIDPLTLKAASGAIILSFIKHIKRTKEFLVSQKRI